MYVIILMSSALFCFCVVLFVTLTPPDIAVGWHGDDGHKFHRSGRGAAYGPAFGPGDVVGCGLDFSGMVFRTV